MLSSCMHYTSHVWCILFDATSVLLDTKFQGLSEVDFFEETLFNNTKTTSCCGHKDVSLTMKVNLH